MNKLKAFMKRYGFYALLACCVVAIAAVTYSAVDTLLEPAPIDTQTGDETPTWDIPDLTPPMPDDVPSEPLPEQQSELPPSDLPEPSSSVSVIIEPSEPQYVSPTGSLAIIESFSGDTAVYNKTLGEWRTHNGADYQADTGSPVYAVYGGAVSFCGERGLWGTTVELTLDTGYTAVYCGVVPDAALTVGARVEKGDVIAVIGQTPIIEAGEQPHLHFELKTANNYADPHKIINP